MTVCAGRLICYYIIKSVFILIRLIMNATIRALDSGMQGRNSTDCPFRFSQAVCLKGDVVEGSLVGFAF